MTGKIGLNPHFVDLIYRGIVAAQAVDGGRLAAGIAANRVFVCDRAMQSRRSSQIHAYLARWWYQIVAFWQLYRVFEVFFFFLCSEGAGTGVVIQLTDPFFSIPNRRKTSRPRTEESSVTLAFSLYNFFPH